MVKEQSSRADSPLFSIVIVNYNHALYLEQAILSVLGQRFREYELIIVDGGSSDGSVEIIKKYQDKLAWWVSEPDSGQSDAFNKGFRHANGSFFTWLNADDLMLPGTLQIVTNKIKQYPQQFWFSGRLVKMQQNGTIFGCHCGPKKIPSFLSTFRSPVPVFGPSSFFHRKIFFDVEGFDEKLHFSMDTDLWLRFMQKGLRPVQVPWFFWAFRFHEQSKTAVGFKKEYINPNLNKMKNEFDEVASRYDLRIKKFYRGIFLLLKIFQGSIFVVIYFNIRFCGKNIESLMNKKS